MSSDINRSTAPPMATNFLRHVIDEDLETGLTKRQNLPAVITRFPPEPNGYLHIGHAKSIWLNFGLAEDYGGRCHLRFDDTNPERESMEYAESIIESVNWLGYSWNHAGPDGAGTHLYFASDYYQKLYEMAECLITTGHAYVDSQPPEQMTANRGTFTAPGTNSPFRDRSTDESLQLFRQMRAGEFKDGEHILRAKIADDSMASPNMNMRDPALYRIKHASHYRTGDDWPIYPMYDFTQPVSDALEDVTHSICTLEFQDHRPLYDWVLSVLADAGYFKRPLPRQFEFARLNLTYVVTSKRKLRQLVEEKIVEGWDDPRMPTVVGMRRRGYTPEAIRLMCSRTGVTKADGWVDYSLLESCLREDLEEKAGRAIAVLRPLKLIIENLSEGFSEECSAPIHPQHPEMGTRTFQISRELWIEREDFMTSQSKGFFRFYPPIGGQPGSRVRLKYGYVVETTGYSADPDGTVTEVRCKYFPDSKSGTDGANNYKVKGAVHWLSAVNANTAEVRLYDRLFTVPQPDAGGQDFKQFLNPESKSTVHAYIEPALYLAAAEQRFQFERHGYFVADRVDSQPGKPVFNLAVSLKEAKVKSVCV